MKMASPPLGMLVNISPGICSIPEAEHKKQGNWNILELSLNKRRYVMFK